eukprot:2780565-Ditylum_brightwellii.AAC.1
MSEEEVERRVQREREYEEQKYQKELDVEKRREEERKRREEERLKIMNGPEESSSTALVPVSNSQEIVPREEGETNEKAL